MSTFLPLKRVFISAHLSSQSTLKSFADCDYSPINSVCEHDVIVEAGKHIMICAFCFQLVNIL